MEEQICRIELIREDDGPFVVRVTSSLDGTKEFRHAQIEQLLRDVSMDLQLSYAEFTEKTSDYVDPEELDDFREDDY
ncbi:MAG: hypothetical protein KY455_07030 [Euryarchaeota archaeon]|nr:hypothetical protein [Euryarchaeota archaeon]